jgi:lipopolysaccharide/colanic/teichoic acid biosynthesis glycosyltransferase
LAINTNRRAPLLLLVADLISVAAVFNLVFFVRGVSSGGIIWPVLAPAAVLAGSLHLIDGYGSRTDMLSLDYAALHLIASVCAALMTLFLAFAFIPAGFELQSSRLAIVASFAVLGPLTLFYRRIVYERASVSRRDLNLIFVGDAADFDVFRTECSRMGVNAPLLHVDSRDSYAAFEPVLEAIAGARIAVEAIIIKETSGELPLPIPMKLVQLAFEGIPTYTLEIFHEVYWRKIPLYRINPVWLFQEGFQIAREPLFERMKRVSDVLLSAVGLILFGWLIGVAAVAIKLEDRGPVFFVQDRVGKHRVVFRLFKIRTMRVSGGGGDPYTRPGDTRITRVGQWLRSARLDELPQLWNVLLGQMSLIGPRAEWDRLVGEYEREIPCYHFRHLVKPGITGWAQVNYRYGTGVQDTLRKLEYDLYYIRNYSFILDASIVLKTVHVMLLKKGR